MAFALLIVGGTALVVNWQRVKDFWLPPPESPSSAKLEAPLPKERVPRGRTELPPARGTKVGPKGKGHEKEPIAPSRPGRKTPFPFSPLPHSLPVPSLPPPRSAEPDSGPRVQVAIVIDDLGWDPKAARALIELDFPLTFAILPSLPYSESVARLAQQKRREILLHLPMEPQGYPKVDPGKGALLREMDEDTLESLLLQDLKGIPNPVGVNNHMGSSFTEDDRAMRVVLKVLKRRGLFFLDSRTSPNSVAYETAKELGLKAGRRQVFLDNGDQADPAAVEKQIWRLVHIAQKEGRAIGIGHPHPYTLEALRRTLPQLKENGVEVVPVSRLVD